MRTHAARPRVRLALHVRLAAAEALRGHGGILLNHRGKRFVNELGRRDEVTTAMYQWCTAPGESESQGERDAAAIVMPSPVHAWLVLSRKAAASVGPNFNFYWKVKHLFTEVDGVAGLAKAMGDESKAGELADELAAYNEVAKSGE
ncbi:FAD-binding protein, partial [archaeon]